ncbi:MAG: serine hydrolase [Bacteroidetes bacterium]|nr:serine hydrolase [Bacteroidota bacterium]
MLKKVLPLILISLQSFGQDAKTRWVDSVFSTLDLQHKVGQLFMVPVSSYATMQEKNSYTELVRNNGIGAVQIIRGGPVSHAKTINELQRQSRVPLLVGISAEWGVAQTLDSLTSLPKPMVSASWKYDSLRFQWASVIGSQLKALGIHLNFAPHADEEIKRNDYLRYFANTQQAVARHAATFVEGMNNAGILTAAKHLPRELMDPDNADTTTIINLNAIDTVSLHVFSALIRSGVDAILTDHMHLSMQTERGLVHAGLSQVFVSEVLRKRLSFNGLVIASVDEYKSKTSKIRTGEAEFLAFQTGNDLLISSGPSPAAIRKLSKLIKKNKNLLVQLDQSVKRILGAKYDAGLNSYHPVTTVGLRRRLESVADPALRHQWAEATPTLLQNGGNLLPIANLEQEFHSVSIGSTRDNEFTRYLEKYVPLNKVSILSARDTTGVRFPDHSIVIVNIASFGSQLEDQVASWITRLGENVVIVHFGNPLKAARYTKAKALILAYTDQDQVASVVPQIIFGGLACKGISPVAGVTAGNEFETNTLSRFSYGVPEEVGMDSQVLERIQGVMKEAIESGATPGCHVLVAKEGKVVYEQSAGSLTYEKKQPVEDGTIYDLASVTKISATLQAVMYMYDHGMIDVYKKASVYLPELKASNKEDFTLKDILTHQAGLWPFLPFWTQTMKDSKYIPEYYSTTQSEDYPFPVSKNLFASKSMKDSLWKWIVDARIREKPLRTPHDYRYSDMGFYIMQHLSEKLLQQPLEVFLEKNFYGPLGAYTTGYLPLNRFPASRIAPTENDTLFRKSLLVGYVHDQGAAMHGGIAGHAGLFSTANDLAKLGQMWLQRGYYGGRQFYKPETLDLFTTKQYDDSRRGLGWDKPPQSDWTGPTSLYASPRTFGHTGFTGTCIWVDPEFNLVYVFLSNRVNPDMNNNKLLSASIRSRVQDFVYQAIFNYCASHP